MNLWNFDSTRDGQLTVAGSPKFSPWFGTEGMSEVTIQGTTTGGTTAYKVEHSSDGSTVARMTADLAASVVTDAGAKVNVAWRYFRLRLEQTMADTSNAQISVKGTD